MGRRKPTLEDRITFVRSALEARSYELEAERDTAPPERAAEIAAELKAIRERLESLIPEAIRDLTELGEPLPCATRIRTLTTDGFRIETIDSGKEVVCRYWRDGEERPDEPQIKCSAGRYMPCVNVRLEQIEHTAWCIASRWTME
jgi:hypothetical protein